MKYAHKMKKDGREEACKAEKRRPEKLESKNKKDPEAYSSWEEKSQRLVRKNSVNRKCAPNRSAKEWRKTSEVKDERTTKC